MNTITCKRHEGEGAALRVRGGIYCRNCGTMLDYVIEVEAWATKENIQRAKALTKEEIDALPKYN